VSAVFASLPGRWPRSAWLRETWRRAEARLRDHSHGDLPRWRAALAALPPVATHAELERAAPRLRRRPTRSGCATC